MFITNLLDVNGAAARFGVSRPTVFRLLESGALPYVRVTPGCRRIAESDLAEFISARRSAA